MNYLYYGFVILVFFSITLLIEAAYLWWQSHHSSAARRIENRVRMVDRDGRVAQNAESILKQRALGSSALAERMLLRVPRIHSLDQWLVQTGLGWSVQKFAFLVAIPAVAVLLICSLFYVPLVFTCTLMVLVGAVAPFWAYRAKEKRFKQLEEQLPEAADMLSRSLKAGHSFATALGMVGDEMPDPIASEFRIAFDQTSFGVPLNDALGELATRVPIPDLRYFVIAVLIQRESGGNLAEILSNISQLVRSRLALLGKVRALSAEGRLSAWVLGAMPFGLGGLMSIVNPDVLPILWNDPAGFKMIEVSLVAMLFGFVWMRKIVRIHV
ncbi:type II secretion system F family protein [Paraburkholderia hospita]|uniref:Pilus assembly protein TadB n=1 Tax=Paraburkholderia hospita TaxID=169430 RepID=A0AAN1J9J8_9BURK|nr:type II secretion system F family protein [Paraburkholderia hospita]AUT69228.1 pilus assembly protein TadB [Paraburkholderia hospita]SEI16534.1 tight adherence protein B [Paraburkholderia hospita]